MEQEALDYTCDEFNDIRKTFGSCYLLYGTKAYEFLDADLDRSLYYTSVY